MKKILLILLIPLLLTTSCSKKEIDTSSGKIEGIKYEETDEITNYIKITMEDEARVILLELYPEYAPITVENFQKLVSEKFYDGLTIHRVSKSFVIQGGDPKGDGSGGSDETIFGEFRRNGFDNKIKHERGVISMARRGDDRDSATSQFFICLNNVTASQLDGEYAAFGKVIAGMDNVDAIASVEVEGETPLEKPVIHSIRFVNIEK